LWSAEEGLDVLDVAKGRTGRQTSPRDELFAVVNGLRGVLASISDFYDALAFLNGV